MFIRVHQLGNYMYGANLLKLSRSTFAFILSANVTTPAWKIIKGKLSKLRRETSYFRDQLQVTMNNLRELKLIETFRAQQQGIWWTTPSVFEEQSRSLVEKTCKRKGMHNKSPLLPMLFRQLRRRRNS